MTSPKLEPEYKPAAKLEKKQALEKSRQLLLLYRLLGHIPQDLMSLDPEQIKKYIAKRHPELNSVQKEGALNRLLDLISDIGSTIGMLFAFDFSYNPAQENQPVKAPAPRPGAPAPRFAKNPALFFNKPLMPVSQPKKKPELEKEIQLQAKRKLPTPFLTLLKPGA